MVRILVGSPAYSVLLGALCGAVGFRLGWRSGNRFLLPLAEGLFGWVAFVAAWRVGGFVAGALAVAGWIAAASAVGIATFRRAGVRVDERVLHARAYRESMLAWLRTGRGPEAAPLATARAHLRELGLYLAAALVSGNLLSLLMGAVLLNSMNAWVATAVGAARRRLRAAVLAWPVWSVVRVLGYVALGSACAGPALVALGWPPRRGEAAPLLVVGAGGVVLDLVLKLGLSRTWARALAAAVDLAAARGKPEPELLRLGLDDTGGAS